jgi:hypothetical protein
MKNNQQMHHHQSISKLYIDHAALSFFFIFSYTQFTSFLSSTFLLFWFALDFLVSSSCFIPSLLQISSFSSRLCVHLLTFFFLFRHCPLISCSTVPYSLDCVLFSSQRQPTRSPFLFYPLYTLVRESSAFMILSFLCYTHKKGTFLFFILPSSL